MNTELICEWFKTGVFWFGTIVGAASVVVKATPTQKDDAVLAKIVKVLEVISLFSAKIEETNKKDV